MQYVLCECTMWIMIIYHVRAVCRQIGRRGDYVLELRILGEISCDVTLPLHHVSKEFVYRNALHIFKTVHA